MKFLTSSAKKENYLIISRYRKVFNKIQHSLIIKISQQTNDKKELVQLDKENLQLTTYKMVGNLKHSHQDQEQGKDTSSYHCFLTLYWKAYLIQ